MGNHTTVALQRMTKAGLIELIHQLDAEAFEHIAEIRELKKTMNRLDRTTGTLRVEYNHIYRENERLQAKAEGAAERRNADKLRHLSEAGEIVKQQQKKLDAVKSLAITLINKAFQEIS